MDKQSKSGIIYQILCPDKYFYYGSSFSSLSSRTSWHKNKCKNGFGHDKLYDHLNKWEWQHLKFILIETYECYSKKELLAHEDTYIIKCLSDTFCLNTNRSFLSVDDKKKCERLKRLERKNKNYY